ncbi:nickel ABC transporter substrate-binding protein [Bradyrhizobium sp. LHD-71]|uniref:nickel ABC transporter substrate-binding protein n=1 Tax=Bradyrhizobium sp. LHD-71 TaxID=3072141 RepID=UPI00280C660D|nr:nickel ABC transporter substrate-binding protein [Bradyrhizobium sp. LHD-71]MDQ8726977.1 nickel ABC transporter substrate-binding protein [Bradyrhizobium sp. LHD-71]
MVVAAATLGLPAAGKADPALNFSWFQNAGPLNPHLYTPNQMFAQGMVYEPLVKYQADGSVSPWLAQSWEASPDGKTYTFKLRQDVSFSNGEKFDAAAVVANVEAILANRERHTWLELMNQIVGAEALDAYTVRLTLKDAYYPFLQELALPRPMRFIAPSQFKDGGTKSGIKAPIGTGPWKLTETRLGEYDVFTRNDSYWGAKPAYEKITVKVISDPNMRAVAFETGQIDLIYGADGPISPDMFARFAKMRRYATALSDPIQTRALAINSAREPTSDLAVRKALNHAVDKDMMIATVFHGTQKKADALFASNVPYADIGLEPYNYDPALAAKLLDEDGWRLTGDGPIRSKNGKPLTIEFSFAGTDAISKSIAEIVQADLRKVGIDTVLVGEEESSVYARQKDGRFGMIFNRTWGAPYDPHAFVSSMRVPSHADYRAQLGLARKAEIDAEIGKVLTTTDEATRKALYKNIFTYLHEQAVYLPLTYATIFAVAKPEVGPLQFGAMATEIPFEKLKPGAK